jgi:protein TonB
MAVPVGNTVATGPRDPAPGPRSAASPSAGPPAFVPVADVYITQQPQIIFEVNSADIYPSDARRLGVEGTVQLRVGIDENGDVKEVKITKVKPPGYQFDEAARGALLKAKFRPARGSDGKPVPARINYNYTFTLGQ